MKFNLLIEKKRYSSALSSTSSLKMALVGQQHTLAALTTWNSSYTLKSKVYVCSFFNVVTKDGISWTAWRPCRFNPMKFKLLIEKESYTSALSSSSSLKMALFGQQHSLAALTTWNSVYKLKRKVYHCSFFNVVTNDGISWTATRPAALTQWNSSYSLKSKVIPLLFLQRRH
jgi:phage gpG-like protein